MHYSKDTPFLARLKERCRVDKPGSTKPTFHVSLDIEGSGIAWRPGDSIGVLPSHSDERVTSLLQLLELDKALLVPFTRYGTVKLVDAFKHHINLNKITKKAALALAETTDDFGVRNALETLCLDPATFKQDPRFMSLEAFIKAFKPTAEHTLKLLDLLPPLLPRFYSIASSPKKAPGHIDLLIAPVGHDSTSIAMKGVASDFLCETAEIKSTPIPIFIQKSAHFYLPSCPSTPLIMIGPGTGIAPFRAFLQERHSMGASGENLLFFGERHSAYNYTYQDYIQALEKEGFIKAFTAFSRDGKNKRYVQHLMLEQAKDLFEQIDSHGAHIYICGDAKMMAKQVRETLITIISQEGKLPLEEAHMYLKALIKNKRLRMDVY